MVKRPYRGNQEQLNMLRIQTSPLESFTFLDQADNIRYRLARPHTSPASHAFSGLLRLKARNSLYLLPPQRAVSIPAGVFRGRYAAVPSGCDFLSSPLIGTDWNHERSGSSRQSPIGPEMVPVCSPMAVATRQPTGEHLVRASGTVVRRID